METRVQPPTPDSEATKEAPAEGPCGLAEECCRLAMIIRDYAKICQQSSREIRHLRAKIARLEGSHGVGPEAIAVSEGDGTDKPDPPLTGTGNTPSPVDIDLRNNLRVCRERNVELVAEVERLRSQPCPHVVGETTQYCSLTPFAWAADIPGKFGAAPTVLFGYTEKLVKGLAAAGGDSVQPFPLYRQPSLTKEEREAIAEAAHACGNCNGFGGGPAVYEGDRIAATLNGLLERLN